LEVSEDDFSLQEEHFSLQVVPLVEVVLDNLLELVFAGVLNVLLGSASLADDPLAFSRLPLLLLFQLLSCLLSQQCPELLLALGGHESLLLGHCDLGVVVTVKASKRGGVQQQQQQPVQWHNLSPSFPTSRRTRARTEQSGYGDWLDLPLR